MIFYRLESPTRTLNIKAPEGVGIESRAGDISASCLKDLKLQSKEGSVSMIRFLILCKICIKINTFTQLKLLEYYFSINYPLDARKGINLSQNFQHKLI